MKKLYSLLAVILVAATSTAQLQTEIESSGVFKLTYGASGDYSIYDPGFGTATFYVHCWVNAADNTTGTMFDDAWTNSTVTMNWDTAVMAYTGKINLNTKTFTNTNNKIPAGTTVAKMGIVFKDLQNGATKQSADLTVMGPTTVVTLAVSNTALQQQSAVVNGKLITSQKGNLSISVYEMSGKLLKNFTSVASGEPIDLGISKNGLYLVKISNGSASEVVKFAK